jgi:hypothetical protein
MMMVAVARVLTDCGLWWCGWCGQGRDVGPCDAVERVQTSPIKAAVRLRWHKIGNASS